MSEPIQAQRGRGRRQLLGIMAVTLATLGGSYLIFYLVETQGVWGTTNHGKFVTPHTTTADLGWQLGEDEARHWWLWVVDEGCETPCRQKVKDLRALHILLSKEAGRVRRGYTNTSGGEVELGEPYPKLHRIALRSGMLETGVYIVDPNGNLVLFYPMDIDPALIKEDLRRLLKVSQIG